MASYLCYANERGSLGFMPLGQIRGEPRSIKIKMVLGGLQRASPYLAGSGYFCLIPTRIRIQFFFRVGSDSGSKTWILNQNLYKRCSHPPFSPLYFIKESEGRIRIRWISKPGSWYIWMHSWQNRLWICMLCTKLFIASGEKSRLESQRTCHARLAMLYKELLTYTLGAGWQDDW